MNQPPGESVEADVEAVRDALANIGPCDTEDRNPHRKVWCIAHQQKRCHAEAETAAALQALTNLTDRIGELERDWCYRCKKMCGRGDAWCADGADHEFASDRIHYLEGRVGALTPIVERVVEAPADDILAEVKVYDVNGVKAQWLQEAGRIALSPPREQSSQQPTPSASSDESTDA